MTIRILTKVDLGDGKIAWVGTFNEFFFVIKKEEKLLSLLIAAGLDPSLPDLKTLDIAEFEKYASEHPILSAVPDWGPMGIPFHSNKGNQHMEYSSLEVEKNPEMSLENVENYSEEPDEQDIIDKINKDLAIMRKENLNKKRLKQQFSNN